MNMKTYFKSIVILLISTVLIACSKKASNAGKLEVIDCTNLKTEEHMDLKDSFNCKSVVLETTSESLIGSINKVMIYKDLIYVFDARKSKALCVFDLNGKYLFKISPFGKGKGEALYISDFDIYNDNIIFLSSANKKLLFYDLKGKFVKEIKSKEIHDNHLTFFSNDLFATINCSKGEMIVDFLNSKGKVIKSYRNKYFPGRCNYGVFKCCSNCGENTYINFPFCDTIYSLTDNKEVIPSIFFDFGSKRFPIEKFKTKEEIKNARRSGNYSELFSYKISEKYVFANISIEHRIKYLFYNRKTHEVSKAINILSVDGIYLPVIIGDVKNGFISSIDANIMYQIINGGKEKSYNKFSNIKPDDNPVLFIVTEKK